MVIIAIDYTNSIIKLHPILEAEATTRNNSEPPTLSDINTDTSWDFD